MEVPQLVQNSIGSQSIEKGDIGGQLRFYAWDTVTPCTGRLCPTFMNCTFALKDKVEEIIENRERGIEEDIPRCGIMQNYLSSITSIIFRNYAEDLTEAQLYRIGMGLIPSYRQLCRLKIVELGLDSVTYTTINGEPKLHPIFHAIRDQIVSIEKMWHTIGLNKLDDLDLSKSNNAYDAMQEEANQSVLNRKKG